jgi:hypothetical protein
LILVAVFIFTRLASFAAFSDKMAFSSGLAILTGHKPVPRYLLQIFLSFSAFN